MALFIVISNDIIMVFIKSKVYKKAKALIKLAKVAEFQSFIHCISSKISRGIKYICINQVEKINILYTHPKREEWFEKEHSFV